MKFPRVQSEIVRQRKVPVESLKSPIWSMHFLGLVPDCTIAFHAHFSHSDWPNGRNRKDLEIMILRYLLGIAERKM